MTPSPQDALNTRAIESAAETAGILKAHLSHHDRMEQDAAVERRDLRNSISKVHVRLNQVGLLLILGLLGLVGYMLVNPLPWKVLDNGL